MCVRRRGGRWMPLRRQRTEECACELVGDSAVKTRSSRPELRRARSTTVNAERAGRVLARVVTVGGHDGLQVFACLANLWYSRPLG